MNNKSETPRTDAARWPCLQLGRGPNRVEEFMVTADFARQLERELTAAKQEVEELTDDKLRKALIITGLEQKVRLLDNDILGLNQERDSLLQQLEQYKERCKFTYCAYCDWKTNVPDPDALQLMQEHAASCVNHPMFKLRQQLSLAQSQLAEKDEALAKIRDLKGQRGCEPCGEGYYIAKQAISTSDFTYLQDVKEVAGALEISHYCVKEYVNNSERDEVKNALTIAKKHNWI